MNKPQQVILIVTETFSTQDAAARSERLRQILQAYVRMRQSL